MESASLPGTILRSRSMVLFISGLAAFGGSTLLPTSLVFGLAFMFAGLAFVLDIPDKSNHDHFYWLSETPETANRSRFLVLAICCGAMFGTMSLCVVRFLGR